MKRILLALGVLLALAGSVAAQQTGSVRGQVTDETAAAIPGATVTVSNGAGPVKSVTSGADGTYVVTGLAPGTYNVVATSPGLKQFQPSAITVSSSPVTLNLQLRVVLEKQEVTVQGETAPTVSTDPSSNAGTIVLKQQDLDALSDDPDDLQQDLQALAGPAAGPDGGQIYIDGFTGGRLPPKESIREIRINQNPFSAEFDKMGFGRIEILTKPGYDNIHGQIFFNTSDMVFDSRNPFLTTNLTPNFSTRQYGGNIGGPIQKNKSSFFLDFERREINDDAIFFAPSLSLAEQFPLPGFGTFAGNQFLPTPQTRTTFSPRLDYQLSTNNTLTARYTWWQDSRSNQGVGNTTMQSAAYNQLDTQSTAQIVETSVLNAKTVNETRFQYWHEVTNQTGLVDAPTLNVEGAFSVGGYAGGNNSETDNHYELQNYTTYVTGAHTLKFGIRVRAETLSNVSPSNFNGTFLYTSLQQFEAGALPSQFTLTTGIPQLKTWYGDVGPFAQDDWKVKPNLTLSFGLRWEGQNHVHDWSDFAPRFGFAWAPGAHTPSARQKTVIRGGSGLFYSRFAINNTLEAERYNGITQTQYRFVNPCFQPVAEPASELLSMALACPSTEATPESTSIYQVDPNLRSPYIIQSAIGIDRQLPKNTTLSVNFMNSRGVHMQLLRDINAPYIPGDLATRPQPLLGDIYQFESNGILNQNQVFVQLNSRLNSNMSMFVTYVYNHAMSNTDGASSPVMDPYNLGLDYGRAAYDIPNRIFMAGSANLRWNVRLSPFLMWTSSTPFNLTTGDDLFGTGFYNTRPALAGPGEAGIATPCGVVNPDPTPGDVFVQRNCANGPGFFSLNLRVSKTFGFGAERSSGAGNTGGGGGGNWGGGRGGPGGGGPGGGMRGMFGDASTTRRYNLTIGVMARNLFNTFNPATPVGVITSPFFLQSTNIAGGYGASNAVDRRVEFQARLTF